jgi:hypothetical protein
MHKTLLFTTSYCTDLPAWDRRIYKWYKYFSSSPLYYDKLLILDDKSPLLPNWENIHNITKPFSEEPTEKNLLISFQSHLGRLGMLDYPGWYRSYSFAARYAKKFNYKKVIHIESDSYLISNKIFDYFNKTESGWSSLWCKRYNFPENALQIICKDQIDNFYKTTLHPYNFFKNKVIEIYIPFTHINKNFIGDRYHEYRDDIPIDADFASQVKIDFDI